MEAEGPASPASLGPRHQGVREGRGLGLQGQGRVEATGETLDDQRRDPCRPEETPTSFFKDPKPGVP